MFTWQMAMACQTPLSSTIAIYSGQYLFRFEVFLVTYDI